MSTRRRKFTFGIGMVILILLVICFPRIGVADPKETIVKDDWTSLSTLIGQPIQVRGYLGLAPNKGQEYCLYNLARTNWVKLVVDDFKSIPADASAGKVIVTVQAMVIRAPNPTESLGQSRRAAPNECYLVHVWVDGTRVRSSTYDEDETKK